MVNVLLLCHICLVIIQHYLEKAVLNTHTEIVYLILCFADIMIIENINVNSLIRDHACSSVVLVVVCLILIRINAYLYHKNHQTNLLNSIINNLSHFTRLSQINHNNNIIQLINYHQEFKICPVGGFKIKYPALANKKYANMLMVNVWILLHNVNLLRHFKNVW